MLEENKVNAMNPLVWAFLGDAVFDLFIRERTAANNEGSSVHVLHKKSIAYVNSKSQSAISRAIADSLSDEEKDILRRGRNSHSGTIPKNADMAEYKQATGFEALIGYLYLKRREERLAQILEMAAGIIEEK
jgi:ribonuclease-3 family protein